MKDILAMGVQPPQLRKSLIKLPSPREQAKIIQKRQPAHMKWSVDHQS